MAIFAFGVVAEGMVSRLNLVLNSVTAKDTTNSFFKKEGYKYKNLYVKKKKERCLNIFGRTIVIELYD